MARDPLGALEIHRKAGDEPVHANGERFPWTVLTFWQWSGSDLVSNTQRGILAEYLVACAINVADGARVEWDAVDLRSKNGLKIEVRSAAYLQSWHQARLSAISFPIGPRRGMDAATNTVSDEARRLADVFVFALLKHQDKTTLDPLDVAQWDFYIVPTRVLDTYLPMQKSLSLTTLQRFCPHPVAFEQLDETIGSITLVMQEDAKTPLG